MVSTTSFISLLRQELKIRGQTQICLLNATHIATLYCKDTVAHHIKNLCNNSSGCIVVTLTSCYYHVDHMEQICHDSFNMRCCTEPVEIVHSHPILSSPDELCYRSNILNTLCPLPSRSKEQLECFQLEKYVHVEDNLWALNLYASHYNIDTLLFNSLQHITWLLGLHEISISGCLSNAFLLYHQGNYLIFSDDPINNTLPLLDLDHHLTTIGNIGGDHRYLPLHLIKNHGIVDCPILWSYQQRKSQQFIQSSIESHTIDSICWIKLLFFIKTNRDSIRDWTEYDLRYFIDNTRRSTCSYLYKSFDSIVAFKSSATVLHYHPSQYNSKSLDEDGLLLLDLGAHYMGGTTDVSRTVSLGEPTDQQRLLYTKVLKSHLFFKRCFDSKYTIQHNCTKALSLLKPYSCPHLLTHGVGYMQSVHEPGFMADTYLKPHNIITNEPGIYEQNCGIRIENVHYMGYCGKLHDLTVVPYETSLIDLSLLDDVERKQITSYWQLIKQRVWLRLSTSEQDFLRNYVGTFSL